MRLLTPSLTAAVLLTAAAAQGQGLLSLQNTVDRKAEDPMTYSATLGAGYDSLNFSATDVGDIDSLFLQGGVSTMFSDNDRTTPWNLGFDLGTIYYLDAAEGVDDTNYTARAAFNIAHEFSTRLRVNNNFFLTYEVEPNFGVGASTARRAGQYFYGFNNFSVAYAWSERFSTTSSYTVDGIKYDDSAIGQFEDRLSHLFAQQFSYAVSKTLKAVGEYRFRTTRYQNASSANFMSHYLLAGVDKAWSERSTGSFRAGAEFYDSKRTSQVAPYFEAALSHAASEKTSMQLFASVGYDGSELNTFGSRYSYRTGVTANHQVSERLRLTAGLNHVYSEFNGDEGARDVNEHQFNATTGVGYRVWDNITLDANYTYTLLSSDDDFRDYDRNRIFLGVNATF